MISAGVANLAVGGLIIALAMRQGVSATGVILEDAAASETQSPTRTRMIIFAIGISGAIAMLYELVWIRMVAFVFGSLPSPSASC